MANRGGGGVSARAGRQRCRWRGPGNAPSSSGVVPGPIGPGAADAPALPSSSASTAADNHEHLQPAMASPVTGDTRPLVNRHLEASDPARPPRGLTSSTNGALPRAGRATRLLSGIVLCCLAGPVASETWSERAGVCDEWAGAWTVTQACPGVWTGTATQRNVGGSCAPADDRILTGAVEGRRSAPGVIPGLAREAHEAPRPERKSAWRGARPKLA